MVAIIYKFMIVWLLSASAVSPLLPATPGTTLEEQEAAVAK